MPYDTDSFHFMRYERIEPPTGVGSTLPIMVHKQGIMYTRIFLMCLSALISVLIFSMIRNWTGTLGSILISCLFSLDPLWLMQSANIVDKNMIYMLALIGAAWLYQDKMIYTLMTDKQAFWVKHTGYIFCILIALFAWEGWPVVTALIIVMLLTKMPFLYKGCIHIISFTILCIMLGNRLISSQIVREMRSAWEFLSPIYILYIVVVIFFLRELMLRWLDNERAPWMTDIFFVTLFAALLMFRNIIFFIPFVYIAGAWTFSEVTNTQRRIGVIASALILSFFIAVILMLSAPAYMRSSTWTPDMEKALIYADSLNTTCIITDWGIGNIAQYYTDKTVPMMGHPDMKRISYYILNDSSCSKSDGTSACRSPTGLPTDCVAVYSTGQDEVFKRYAEMQNHTIDIYDRKIIKEYGEWKVSLKSDV